MSKFVFHDMLLWMEDTNGAQIFEEIFLQVSTDYFSVFLCWRGCVTVPVYLNYPKGGLLDLSLYKCIHKCNLLNTFCIDATPLHSTRTAVLWCPMFNFTGNPGLMLELTFDILWLAQYIQITTVIVFPQICSDVLYPCPSL